MSLPPNASKGESLSQNKVVINCRSEKTLHPELLKSLLCQNSGFKLEICESSQAPIRLSHIQDPQTLYFFFDEDVSLPNFDYLEKVQALFHENPKLLFLAGSYLSPKSLPYLGRCYNSLIRLWMQIDQDHCLNAPGGVWVISGQIQPYLKNWQEPRFWAGEDTYTLRFLQNQGLQIHYSQMADVYHHSFSGFSQFIHRALRQGMARETHQLETKKLQLNWTYFFKSWKNWPGWSLHQVFVFMGTMKSKTAAKRPKTSPTA